VTIENRRGRHGLAAAVLCGAALYGVCATRAVHAGEPAAWAHVAEPYTAGAPTEPPFDAGFTLPEPAGGAPLVDSEHAPGDGTFQIAEIDRLMSQALATKKTPGAVVAVGRSTGVLFLRAYGRREIVPRRVEMTPDTIFDLASLTKPLVTATLVQVLIDQGKLSPDDRVVKYLPEFELWMKERVTIEQLLLHTSGLPSSNPLSEYQDGPAKSLARALNAPVLHVPSRHFEYSDIGYIALGVLIERVTGERLDIVAKRLLWEPLGMADTQYCASVCRDPRIAPTDLSADRKMSPIRGQVHDPRAYRLGGIAGNAGLFSSARDLVRYARLLLSGGELDGVRILSPEGVRRFTEPRQTPGGYRTPGWDVNAPGTSARGTLLSTRAYGHLGYTGTSLWIDPERDLFVLFLSNRNHPYGTGRVLELEGAIADAAVRALEPQGVESTAL
jgi:CubicO group peptidase (beta-lactamase class C family)